LNLSVFENESSTIRPGTLITVNRVNVGFMLTLKHYTTIRLTSRSLVYDVKEIG